MHTDRVIQGLTQKYIVIHEDLDTGSWNIVPEDIKLRFHYSIFSYLTVFRNNLDTLNVFTITVIQLGWLMSVSEFCESCKGGTYQDELGQSSCKQCPAGHQSTPKSDRCSVCSPSMYSTAGSLCAPCAGVSECPCLDNSKCFKGTACVNTGSGGHQCLECPPGYQGDGTNCVDINEVSFDSLFIALLIGSKANTQTNLMDFLIGNIPQNLPQLVSCSRTNNIFVRQVNLLTYAIWYTLVLPLPM